MEVNEVIKSQVEGFIIKWSHQLDEVLSMESQKDLEEGKNPGPDTETSYWEIRFSNLENIHAQLRSKTAQSMVNILTLTKSGYLPLFRYEFTINLKELNIDKDIQ